ncbi:MAG: GHMP kinase [Acidobacteria bacterium]|nr:GHMP kinase [Acidobacteriota bacterium]
MILQSQAPARIDLAGGTLDIWPLYLFHQDAQTLNFAVNYYARCRLTARRDKVIEFVSHDLRLRERFSSLSALMQAKSCRLPLLARLVMAFGPQRGFTLATDSDVPAGSGLGGSSALNIAICGALSRFAGRRLSLPKLIETARNVEAQVLGVPTGEQDYYSAVYGGAHSIRLTPHGVVPEKLKVASKQLSERFLLCYTGESRNSGVNNWEVLKAHVDGNRRVIRQFDRIAAIAAEMRQALETQDWRRTSELLNQEWATRKKNCPGITTPGIERLVAAARRNGALAAKACGAGGGGCVLFLAEPEAKPRLEAVLRRAGASVLPFRVSATGLEVRSGTRRAISASR